MHSIRLTLNKFSRNNENQVVNVLKPKFEAFLRKIMTYKVISLHLITKKAKKQDFLKRIRPSVSSAFFCTVLLETHMKIRICISPFYHK